LLLRADHMFQGRQHFGTEAAMGDKDNADHKITFGFMRMRGCCVL
jgi:hypothetical protein